jgi:hypothetical protein
MHSTFFLFEELTSFTKVSSVLRKAMRRRLRFSLLTPPQWDEDKARLSLSKSWVFCTVHNISCRGKIGQNEEQNDLTHALGRGEDR